MKSINQFQQLAAIIFKMAAAGVQNEEIVFAYSIERHAK